MMYHFTLYTHHTALYTVVQVFIGEQQMGVVSFRGSQGAGIVQRHHRIYTQCGAELYTKIPTKLNIRTS